MTNIKRIESGSYQKTMMSTKENMMKEQLQERRSSLEGNNEGNLKAKGNVEGN